MSERYSRIFSLTENLYTEGSPVIIKAGALLKDNETSWLIAQLKIQNISDKAIKLVKIELSTLDSMGRPLGAPIIHEYLDLSVTRGAVFGSQTPIKISNSSVRSYTVRVTEVGFADNSMWTDNQGAWEPIPEQKKIAETITDSETLVGYKDKYGTSAKLSFAEHKDLWLCTCGEVNHSGEEHCHRCNASFAELKNLDIASLKAKGEEIHKEGENAKRKKNKVKKIAIISLLSLLLVSALGYFAIYPAVSSLGGHYTVYINMYNVKEFKVPKGVKKIDDYAFRWCDSLTSVVIPDSVTSIGYNAFYDCNSLTSVVIPDSVTSIGEDAFRWCDSLTNVTIGTGVTNIGDYAFMYCDSLTSIKIPNSVTSIGRGAFYDCDSLTSVVIPDSVTNIGDYAFKWCDSLTNVTIGTGVTNIGDYAFMYCDSLTSVVIPDSVTSIGEDAFDYCDSLESITYNGTIAEWNKINKGNIGYGIVIYCTDGTTKLR